MDKHIEFAIVAVLVSAILLFIVIYFPHKFGNGMGIPCVCG